MKLSRLLILGAFCALCALFASNSFAQTLPVYNLAGQQIGIVPLQHYVVQVAPTGAVTSLTINGQKIAGDVHLEIGGAQTSFDPATNTFLLSTESAKQLTKGGSAEGNTTISGSLTVTGSCFLGTNANTPTYTFGPHYVSHAAPAASTTLTITADETEIADAGATVTLTMPGAPPSSMSRRITLINESATYSATDGASVTVSPGSKLELTYDVTAGLWK